MKQGWEVRKLGEVCEIKPPKNEAKEKLNDDDLVSFLPMEDLGVLGRTVNAIKQKPLKEVAGSYTYFADNDVLLAKITPCFENGKLGIARNLTNGIGFGSSEYIVFRSNGDIFEEYLFYFLSQETFREEGRNNMNGAVGHKRVSKEFIENYKIPLPPLPEQQRIVAILDEAFVAIAKAKAKAEQNLKNAKELFESALQLTMDNGKLKIGEGEWEEKTLKELTTILGDGLHGTPKYTINGDYYFINGNNLTDGIIEFKESTKRVSIEEYNKHKKNLTNRTVFVSINGTLGNVAFYKGEKIILGKSACYFNLKESVDKNFIRYVLSSKYFLNYAHKEATGATIKNVSLKTMREFLVPIPSITTQQTIVRQLDALRAETKKLEAIYQRKINDLEELKKSVLQKAFAGELTIDNGQLIMDN